MTVLPRVLYLLHTLLIRLPKKFFSLLNTTLRDFIWAGKKSRISMLILTNPKSEGGINLPHFKHYYYATHLIWILEWNCQSLQAEIPLWFLPWVTKEARPSNIALHPTIGPMLEIFHAASQQYNSASTPGPLTPLIHNTEFALGHTTATFPHREDETPMTVAHCVDNGKLKTFDKLKSELQAKHFTQWQYRQLHNYVHCTANRQQFLREQTWFEQMCITGEPVSKATSLMYNWLQTNKI